MVDSLKFTWLFESLKFGEMCAHTAKCKVQHVKLLENCTSIYFELAPVTGKIVRFVSIVLGLVAHFIWLLFGHLLHAIQPRAATLSIPALFPTLNCIIAVYFSILAFFSLR